ncbi:MAG: hypothetical protein GY827_02100 [Cytophagales bacterium]|nr:hypothetical protein [Cytophagales bacterium]
MLKTAHYIIAFFACTFVWGQEYLESGYYPFINYQDNHIHLGQASALDYFFTNLDSLAKGEDKQINIVQIGDSHIQADFLSNHLRKRTQTTFHFGNGGKGFIFPYRLAKTNNPYSYHISYTGKWTGQRNSVSKHKYDWGVSGIVATTSNSKASFTVKLNTSKTDTNVSYNANNVRLYYPVNSPKSYEVYIKQGDDKIEGKIDSLGGYIEFELDTVVEKIRFQLRKTNSGQKNFHIEGILLNNDENGIVFHSIGVNGAQYKSYLRCPKFTQHLKTLNPHLIILSLGTNDAYHSPFNSQEFAGMVNQLLNWIREASPQTSILLTCPGDNLQKRTRYNPNNVTATEVLFQIAKKRNLATWDLHKIMGGKESIRYWNAYELAQNDFLHLTPKGYLLQGELLFQALIMDTYFGNRQQILSTKH